MSRNIRFPTMWEYVRPAKPRVSLRIRSVWSEPLLVAWIYYENKATDWTPFGVSKLKAGCTGPCESTLVKMPHCWKSHVTAQMIKHTYFNPSKMWDELSIYKNLNWTVLAWAEFCTLGQVGMGRVLFGPSWLRPSWSWAELSCTQDD